MISRESYIERIRPFIGTELIKVLTGLRRSGKSVMLQLIQKELLARSVPEANIISFNFESLANQKYCTATSLYAELQKRISKLSGKVYLFFDEIQEIKDWEKCVNSCRVDFDCDITITGSNAKLLSGELATYLAGRYVEFVIYPFSFSEFILAFKEGKNSSEAFKDYLSYGGMPFLNHLQGDKSSFQLYLRDVYNSVVLKDIVKRNNIRDVDLLERIISYMMANIGHPFSATSLSKYFKNEYRKVAPETILNYIQYACDAHLFTALKREDISGKKILTINEKYYVADHGLREAIYGHNMENIDQVLENIVCMELLRRGFEVTVGHTYQSEIDFIAKKNEKVRYFQVCYLLADPKTIEREFGAFRTVKDQYPKYVLSLDEFKMSRDGIQHYNIRDFLLNDEWE